MIQAQLVLAELKRNHATHVVGLPDNSTVKLFELLEEERDIQLVSATREGEAFAIASGLWIGGKVPVVLVQNTGFFESGDSLRGTAMRMRVPLVCLITYRGYGKSSGSGTVVLDAEALSTARMDSAALITEPTLRAWGVPFAFLHSDADMPRISEAFRKSIECTQPVGILITCDLV
jgi:sulfopyruvate decarboxylase TPP-binding subunit